MKNKNDLEECISCNGYTNKCESYTPNSEPDEESTYCSHYVTLRKEIQKMTDEEKKQVDGTLGKLLERETGSNESKHCRPIEARDMGAISSA